MRFAVAVLVAHGALLAFAPSASIAQDPPDPVPDQLGRWSFRVLADAGTFHSTRDIGKAVGAVGAFNRIQAVARVESSPLVGVGLEAVLPDGSTWVRAMVRTTIGAQADAHIGLCDLLPGDVCDPLIADTRVSSVHGQLGFRQGTENSRVRPSFFFGVGLRRYGFDDPGCSGFSGNADMLTVCDFMRSLFESPPSATPFIELGYEIAVDIGPATLDLRFFDLAGPYGGGGDFAEGIMQNDVFASAGITVPVR